MAQGQTAAMVARESVKEKLSKGLHLTDYLGNETQLPSPDFMHEPNKAVDYLWLTIKCTAIDGVLDQLESWVGPNTRILCCQNGLGSESAIKKRFPQNDVLRVMVQFNVVEVEPGHLHRGSEGAITIEAPSGNLYVKELAAKLNCPLLPVHTSDAMQALLWAKLQLNLGNGVNAMADIPVKAMLEQRLFRRCFALLMSELIAVVKAKGIVLPKVTALPGHLIPKVMTVPDWIFTILGNKMLAVDPTVRTSMWWDLSQGKKTEVHYLNGAVIAEGEALGIPCPANKALVKMIGEAERGERKRGLSAEEMYAELSAV